MTATDTTDDGEEKPTDTETHLGSRLTRVGRVDDVFAAVSMPEQPIDGAPLDVTAYAFDDEPGQVQLTLGDGISVEIVLSPGRARELATALVDAATDAEAEVGQ